jgi:hypothetical protein
LRANTLLRDNLEKAEFNYEEKDSENYQLQIENVRMREAIEILEGLLEQNAPKIEGRVSSLLMKKLDESNLEFGTVGRQRAISHMGNGDDPTGRKDDASALDVNDIYKELIHLRSRNKGLETRIK